MPGSNQDCYPTSRIQKGLVLQCDGQDLSEEGVGFGVPVLKTGQEAVFPGSCVWKAELKGDCATIEAEYSMNFVRRMAVGGRRIDCRTFYRAREWLASQYSRHPKLRKGILYGAELSRMVMSMKDAFVEVPTVGSVKAVYSIMDDSVRVGLDLRGVPDGHELVVMNEQGANHFDSYKDSDELFLEKDAIGSWDEVFSDRASFIDSKNGLYFALTRVEGARMMRGRELLSDRLAWAGLAYILTPGTKRFSYTIRLGRT
ncbi:Uncharacterised protein [uncultured archaeon]|nr:Uncharacterised protein [uncultured archaeon]